MAELHRVPVIVETPQHTGLAGTLDYTSEQPLAAGTLLRVPLGSRDVAGLVWHEQSGSDTSPSPEDLRPVGDVLDALPPFGAAWCELVGFAAGYYQRGLGEVALSVLPPELRKLDNAQLANRIRKLHQARLAAVAAGAESGPEPLPVLSDEQTRALQALAAAAPASTVLLHGNTGSGKTEVYLRAAAQALDRVDRCWCWCRRSTSRRSSKSASRGALRVATSCRCTAR